LLSAIQNVTEFAGVELVDVNQRGLFGNTPLKVTVIWNDIEAARLLLDAGADVNARLEDGYTALHHAAAGGRHAMAALLCQRGASLDARNDDGKTPLDLARLLRHEAIVQLLREGKG
jgi:ankyrin repeat protein